MSTLALALVLLAAFAHAGWNLLAKTAQGGAAFVWLGAVAGCILYVPVLIVALALEPGHLGATAVGFMVVSGALHSATSCCCSGATATATCRSSTPFPAAPGRCWRPGPRSRSSASGPARLALAGAALIVGAVLSLATRPSEGQGAAVAFALLTGVSIAAYTLWDKEAVGDQDISPIVYFWGLGLTNALLLTPWVLRSREGLQDRLGHLEAPGLRSRPAEPARLHPRALRAGAGAGQLRGAGEGGEHPHRHGARDVPCWRRKGSGTGWSRRRGIVLGITALALG